jgi:hypothetical protein
MSAHISRWLSRVVAVLVLIATLAPAGASAANDTSSGALPLTAASSSVSDSLVGSPGGAYRYYSVAYQGGSAPLTFTLTFQPGYGTTGQHTFGFNIYGPNSLALAGVPQSTVNNVSSTLYTFANPAAMSLLVQVYNYTNGMQVGFTLTVGGLAGGSGANIVGGNNTTPAQAVPVTAINSNIGGTITGNAAGAFQFYTLNYPGGQAPMVISMNVTPTYTGQGQAYGFNVYRPNSNGAASTLIARGSVTASDTNSTTISATVTARSAGPYQLQVFNYWPGISVTYGVTTTGGAGPSPMVSGNTDAGHAVVLNSATPGATATLAGNHAGAYNYYLVNYPGSNSILYVSVTYASTGGASDPQLGFNVYNGSTFVTVSHPGDDSTGVHSAVWQYQNANAATFGIQVFNYGDGANASYVINQVGSN